MTAELLIESLIEKIKTLFDVVERYEVLVNKLNNTITHLEAENEVLEIESKCIYTRCADDSPTASALGSDCDGAVLWYLGDDGKGSYPRFCYHCGGKVIKGEI